MYRIVYSTIGKYKVIKTLGKGGTSKVKLGFNPKTKKYVALKILRKKYIRSCFDQI
jgi:serine/threonine protein kinase